jgi:glycine/D-amino acid oxidase-like deaminating enzyme
MRIAIIGAGIFGSEAAIQLAKHGHKVELFEKNDNILSGATSNSTNRLHVGLHYPRDLETALQSKNGFLEFETRFPSAIRGNFNNYYALSRQNSRISLKEYLAAAERAQIEIIAVDKLDLREKGFNTSEIESAWICNEKVIDMASLRKCLLLDIDECNITLNLKTEIKSIESNPKGWILNSNEGYLETFDVLVRATYGSDQITGLPTSRVDQVKEFHKTLVLEVLTSGPSLGMTVVDGDFFTMLPNGFADTHLIYGPTASVLARHVGENPPSSWNKISEDVVTDATANLIRRMQHWAPGIEVKAIQGVKLAIRTIQANVSSTDRRLSEIRNPRKNYYELSAGKIDHAVTMAKNLCKIISLGH